MGKNSWYRVNGIPGTKNEIRAPVISTHARSTRTLCFFRVALVFDSESESEILVLNVIKRTPVENSVKSGKIVGSFVSSCCHSLPLLRNLAKR